MPECPTCKQSVKPDTFEKLIAIYGTGKQPPAEPQGEKCIPGKEMLGEAIAKCTSNEPRGDVVALTGDVWVDPLLRRLVAAIGGEDWDGARAVMLCVRDYINAASPEGAPRDDEDSEAVAQLRAALTAETEISQARASLALEVKERLAAKLGDPNEGFPEDALDDVLRCFDEAAPPAPSEPEEGSK
jgi:hypothetical protein